MTHTDVAPDPAVEVATRVEALVSRVRYVAVLLMLGAALFLTPWSRAGALIAVAAFLAAGIWLHRRAGRVGDRRDALRAERASLIVDGAAAATFFALFLPDPQGVPIAVAAVYAFELALRRGSGGAVLGGALLAAGVGVRVVVQLLVIDGGQVRVALLLVWITVGLLLLVVGVELHRRSAAWAAAVEAQRRTAARFRETVAELLRQADVAPESTQATDLLRLIDELEDSEHPPDRRLGADLALLLTDGWRPFALTPREEEILTMLVAGAEDRQIARRLFISQSTVRNHVHNIRRKVGARTRDDLVETARALRPDPGG
jgi:DNA-binding CsgD family transcriptional regulator